MAKIRKRKLRWTKSRSPQVVGYKLYWSENEEVNYNSKCVRLGNVTEIVLPDDVSSFRSSGGPIEFGVTAIDEIGNESDLVTLRAPYQFTVPEAPTDLYLRKLDEYCSTSDREQKSDSRAPTELSLRNLNDYYTPPARDHEATAEEEILLTDIFENGNRFKSKPFLEKEEEKGTKGVKIGS